MKLDKTNWYGFDHEAVAKRFTGGLTYCNSFCVRDEYKPVAVYAVANPDREKGHKDYVLLQVLDKQMLIRGMDKHEMEPHRMASGLHCKKCDSVIYSVMRHDFHHCACGLIAIDGGKDYTKVSYESGAEFSNVTIDLITDEIKVQNEA